MRLELEKSGQSARSLAAVAGLSPSQLSGYLSGKNTPGLDVADRIGDALGVPLRKLVDSGEVPEAEPWERVPKHLLVALSQVHSDHYPIILNFLESFTIERESSKLAKSLEKPAQSHKKRR